MPVKLKYANGAKTKSTNPNRHTLGMRLLRIALVSFVAVLLVGGAVFSYYYFKYQKVVDQRLASGPLFANVSQIYAAPKEVRNGQKLTADTIARDLRNAGYNTTDSKLGTYQLSGDTIRIKPGPQSYHATDGASINTSGGEVRSITAENGATLAGYSLEPQLITSLSEDKNRTKRRLITYDELPPRMVQAVVAIEDRRFFEHGGVNYLRLAKCAFVDITTGKKRCGGSTLTQQLAKNLFLSPDKSLSRKFAEVMITFQLEARFNKQQIFTMYANEMNLGHRGSYEINGVGEAAQTFFGKDVKQLDLAQCATLAGMFQRPTYYNPYRSPERVMERRNVVLDSMVETNAITESQAAKAKAEPLNISQANIDAGEAPYFVDLVHDQIVQRIGDQDASHQSLRIYTSLDPDLQRVASEAVDIGIKNVDEIVRRQHKTPKGQTPKPITYPQVALVALNPHTGQVLALVGGRNYGTSQLNHALAQRPTGSIFKPIVYATAYNTSLNGTDLDGTGPFTALTQLNDDPTDFGTDAQPYIPGNFEKGEYPGNVTAVTAIAHSLNIATINLAHMVGYDNVAALARSLGVASARGTPSVAIGTYSATPIDMAGVYTAFANNGVHLKPWMLASVRNTNGDIVSDFSPEAKQILDPRVAYLTQSLLESVLNYGTAAAVRARGFTAPAAGKTGTSHDAWFAGYTSNLICIVWVGNDDYTDVKIEGAHAAAPIWAEFMKRAIELPQYSDVKPFTPPDGVSVQHIDRTSDLLVDSTCPSNGIYLAFLDGTAPQNSCSHMSESPQNMFQKIFGIGGHKEEPLPPPAIQTAPSTNASSPPQQHPSEPANSSSATGNNDVQQPEKKKNIFQKIFGGGGDGDKNKPQQPNPPNQ
jgi:penicillin-binding protein 1B